MRDLDSVNSAAKSTRFIFTTSLIIPLFMGCAAWALADGAASKQVLRGNFLGMFGLGMTFAAIISFPIPYLFRWNWEAKYFGAGIFCLSSCSIIGIYPILCIAQYSSLPLLIRLIFLIFELALITRWCLRFVNIYEAIYREKNLFCALYNEETSAVYYSQQVDKKIVDKLLKFDQFPHSKYFVFSGCAALCLTPFATTLTQYIGIPFTHIFLAVFSTPLNLMFLGLATKGWLVFYFYPRKIKRETNKRVYVDISTQPPEFLKSYKINL